MGGNEKELVKNYSRIVFLGTGSGGFVRGKQIRATGGIILQVNDNQFHIDPGPGAVVRAAQYDINMRANTSIFISHSHIGHCNDVNAVIDAMTYSGFDKHGVLVSTYSLINGGEGYSPYLTRFHRDCLEKVIVIQNEQMVAINEVEVKALYAKHTEKDTIGFKFITPNFILAYSSDTEYSPNLVEEYKEADILILNVCSPGDERLQGNLNTKNAIDIVKNVKPRLTIIQHFSKRMLEADPLQEARIIQREAKQQVMAAKDGLIINPLAYCLKTRQTKISPNFVK